MPLLSTTSNSKGFSSVFTEIESSRKLNLKNQNCLKFFRFDISNNAFTYMGLHQYLQRNIGQYVFSRATIDHFIDEGDIYAIGAKAIELLRTAKNPKDKGAGGELGEILLYLLLEQKMKAPKLLSKVELKTSGNQYVFGSDGVHLLSLDDIQFQLILGESKIKGDLKDAVDDAFDSISGVAKDPSNEIRLIEKSILSESFSEEQSQLIESLLVPQKRDTHLSLDNAFGIFLGYTLDIDSDQYSNTEFRQAVANKIQEDIESIADHIEKRIKATGLRGYSFYVFVIPFNNAPKDRAAIINRLRGEA